MTPSAASAQINEQLAIFEKTRRVKLEMLELQQRRMGMCLAGVAAASEATTDYRRMQGPALPWDFDVKREMYAIDAAQSKVLANMLTDEIATLDANIKDLMQIREHISSGIILPGGIMPRNN